MQTVIGCTFIINTLVFYSSDGSIVMIIVDVRDVFLFLRPAVVSIVIVAYCCSFMTETAFSSITIVSFLRTCPGFTLYCLIEPTSLTTKVAVHTLSTFVLLT